MFLAAIIFSNIYLHPFGLCDENALCFIWVKMPFTYYLHLSKLEIFVWKKVIRYSQYTEAKTARFFELIRINQWHNKRRHQ
jgi:hypothetical protein